MTTIETLRNEASAATRAWHEAVEYLRSTNMRGLTKLTQAENKLIDTLTVRKIEANQRLYDAEQDN
jgi:hypothetical protein